MPLNKNFVHKVNHPLALQWHHRFGNPTHALFISQWWQCIMNFITMAINYRNCGIWMHCTVADYDR